MSDTEGRKNRVNWTTLFNVQLYMYNSCQLTCTAFIIHVKHVGKVELIFELPADLTILGGIRAGKCFKLFFLDALASLDFKLSLSQ